MKYAFIVLMLAISPMVAMAQKHNLFADIGSSLNGGKAGVSVTYDYKFTRHFGIGAGLQDYSYFPTIANRRMYVPSVFEDMRFFLRVRKSMILVFLDGGINFYKHTGYYYKSDDRIYTVPNDNGIYTGLGFGYYHRVTKRGSGPYVTVKMITNTYRASWYTPATKVHDISDWLDGTGAFFVGFKF